MEACTAVARISAVGVLMAFAGCAGAQQTYPIKPIRIIVPFPPGGSNDIVARIVGQKLAVTLGVQTLVENRGGGNSIIGSEALLKSAPDGHTIMVTSITTHITTPLLMPTPYDAVKDFAPVATVASSGYLLAVHPSVPPNNLQEFIALAKSRPGQLNYASSTTATHLVTALFSMRNEIKMQHIPYKGGGPLIADLIGGQVHLTFTVPINVVPHIKTGKLKAIAISGEKRFPALPKVPTFTEAGLPGFEVKTGFGILAPAGTPKEIIDKLSPEIGKILAMPDIKEKLAGQGLEPFMSTPEQFAALIKADMAKFAKVIKDANIKFE